MHRLGALLLIGMGALLLGCTTSEVLIPHAVELTAPAQSLPEEELLDVGIVLFDAGVPEGRIEKSEQEQLLEQGIYAHIRRAEAVYMAVQLRDALQRSGQWGMVLVTPEQSTAADLSVNGRIVQSDGDTVRVEVEAVDAAGRTWLDEEYDYRTPAAVYDTRRYAGADPYQDLF
ncbi:MAG: hypothetical protein JXB36_03215, partial [Gammaproteobacteria bacterium]|nr:hypothetical protein [Gammaproteobacteria bacterium]